MMTRALGKCPAVFAAYQHRMRPDSLGIPPPPSTMIYSGGRWIPAYFTEYLYQIQNGADVKARMMKTRKVAPKKNKIMRKIFSRK
jgi:hypothetical protein